MSGTFHSTCRVSEALGDAISACEAIANQHDSGPVIRHRVHAAYCMGRSACCLQGARKETPGSLLVSENIRCNRGAAVLDFTPLHSPGNACSIRSMDGNRAGNPCGGLALVSSGSFCRSFPPAAGVALDCPPARGPVHLDRSGAVCETPTRPPGCGRAKITLSGSGRNQNGEGVPQS